MKTAITAAVFLLSTGLCHAELSDQEKIDAHLCTETAYMVLLSPVGGVDKAMAGLDDCLKSHDLAAPPEATAKLFRTFKELHDKYPDSVK